jgi:hypothetical protein
VKGLKQIIVMGATIALGIAIFRLIAGSDEDSVMSLMKIFWEKEILIRTEFP